MAIVKYFKNGQEKKLKLVYKETGKDIKSAKVAGGKNKKEYNFIIGTAIRFGQTNAEPPCNMNNSTFEGLLAGDFVVEGTSKEYDKLYLTKDISYYALKDLKNNNDKNKFIANMQRRFIVFIPKRYLDKMGVSEVDDIIQFRVWDFLNGEWEATETYRYGDKDVVNEEPISEEQMLQYRGFWTYKGEVYKYACIISPLAGMEYGYTLR